MSPVSWKNILSFGIVGALATVVHAIVAIVLIEMAMLHPFPANAFGFMTGFLASYFGHHRFSFQSDAEHKDALPRFLLVAGAGLVLNQIIVFCVVNLAGLSYYISLAIIISVVPVMTFVISRNWAFVRH